MLPRGASGRVSTRALFAASVTDRRARTFIGRSHQLVSIDAPLGFVVTGEKPSPERTRAFVAMVKEQTASPKTTFVFGSDLGGLFPPPKGLVRTVDFGVVIDTVNQALERHPEEIRALAEAVVHGEARIVFMSRAGGGVVSSRGEPALRRLVVEKMVTIAKLDPQASDKFRDGVAWTGTREAFGRAKASR